MDRNFRFGIRKTFNFPTAGFVQPDPNLNDSGISIFHRIVGQDILPPDQHSDLNDLTLQLFVPCLQRNLGMLTETNPWDVGFMHFSHNIHSRDVSQIQQTVRSDSFTGSSMHPQNAPGNRAFDDRSLKVSQRTFDRRFRANHVRLSMPHIHIANLTECRQCRPSLFQFVTTRLNLRLTFVVIFCTDRFGR
jgi:hypothetical protein